MVICNKRKLIFVHIPKTGGTTVEKRLNLTNLDNLYSTTLFQNGRTLQHMTWDKYKDKFPEKYKTYTTFSIVRNPYTRFLSSYMWMPPQSKLGKLSGQTIEEFIEEAALCNMIKNYFKNPFFEHFLPQWKYIYDSNNNLMIDALFYQEKYHNIDTFLKKKFNCHSTTTFEIGNQHKPILTKENKRKIFLIYKKDFELLGYNETFQQ